MEEEWSNYLENPGANFMKVGIDISPLQGPHRMRGIGYVTQHVINNMAHLGENKISFVFYSSLPIETASQSISDVIDTSHATHEFRPIYPPNQKTEKNLPGKLALFSKIIRSFQGFLAFRGGAKYAGSTTDLSVFIQFDQSTPFPKMHKSCRKILIIYDLIPYILEKDYLWSYTTSRQYSNRRASLKAAFRRMQYFRKIIANSRHADHLIAISESTKQDFIDYLRIKSEKISTVLLGIAPVLESASQKGITVGRYQETCWGPIAYPFYLSSQTRFLLFVGGVDKRRKLEDVVGAFNQLRARGSDIKLVLAGDSMRGPLSISNVVLQRALRTSAYLDDIIFLGFTDDTTRDWLYKNTVAFIFPSVYEGFGLPVLEAMSYGTPVISYRNHATVEVAGDIPYYASDVRTIVHAIEKIQTLKDAERKKLADESAKHSSQYTWHSTAQKLLGIIYEK